MKHASGSVSRAFRRAFSWAPSLLVLGACGGQSEARFETGEPESDFAGGGLPEWLEWSVDAPLNEVYFGVRVVKLSHVLPGVEYREEVASDGEGNFTITTTDLFTPNPDPDLFFALQDGRRTLSFRYRDVRIRDWNLFQQQYAVAILGERTVAGIPTTQVSIERQFDGLSKYIVDFDENTGLILAYQEFSAADNSLLADVYFESLEYDADVSQLDLVQHLFPTTQHSRDGGNLNSIFNFEPLVPAYTPKGYEILDVIDKQEAPDGTRAKVYLTDGLEMIILASQAPLGAEGVPVSSVVSRMQVGSWTAMMGDVERFPVLIAGKVGKQELALVLDSAF